MVGDVFREKGVRSVIGTVFGAAVAKKRHVEPHIYAAQGSLAHHSRVCSFIYIVTLYNPSCNRGFSRYVSF